MNMFQILTNGLRGFAIFFSVTLFVELFRFLVGMTNSFNIGIMDFYTSLLGIILFILISLTQHLIGDK